MSKKIFWFLGNFLIIFSVASLIFTYYPYVATYFFPPELTTPPKVGLFIQIPKIKAQAPIIKNVSVVNEVQYRAALKRGVALAKGTAIPGDNGGSFIFAHSSDYPWNISRYNTIFLRLGELSRGDVIKIFRDGKELDYVVKDKKTVWPTEVKYLKQIKNKEIVIQTCTPVGTDLQRLLIFADPKK